MTTLSTLNLDDINDLATLADFESKLLARRVAVLENSKNDARSTIEKLATNSNKTIEQLLVWLEIIPATPQRQSVRDFFASLKEDEKIELKKLLLVPDPKLNSKDAAKASDNKKPFLNVHEKRDVLKYYQDNLSKGENYAIAYAAVKMQRQTRKIITTLIEKLENNAEEKAKLVRISDRLKKDDALKIELSNLVKQIESELKSTSQ